jgi:pimeloyl-ACP methyl ester carboxylesterase
MNVLTRRNVCAFCVAIALQITGSARGDAPVASAEADSTHLIPVTDVTGRLQQLHTRICRPESGSRATLVVINHGSPHGAENRPGMQLIRCDAEAVQWFLKRGYVVALPLRRGYGETGGAWAEDYGSCHRPDYVHAGLETARDIDAVIQYATALPFVRADGAIVVGQSAGGWGTIAYAALPHQGGRVHRDGRRPRRP